MITINNLAKLQDPKIIILGDHPGVVQSILDFDFLIGRAKPTVICVVGTQQHYLRYFWGSREILLPGFNSLDLVDPKIRRQAVFFVTAQSGRRATSISQEALQKLPNVQGGMLFAEGVPEVHAVQLRQTANQLGKFVIGPASVGMVIGGIFKLGAIGGTLPEQIAASGTLHKGKVAVISTSGGMVNELINAVASAGSGISFAAAVGGERYPITRPAELVDQALRDPSTRAIVYFGELGGVDEYEIASLLKSKKSRKPFIAYIAGSIAEQFESAPQFGHAKALAQDKAETASAKKKALAAAGADVASTYASFERKLTKLPKVSLSPRDHAAVEERLALIQKRRRALFIDRISSDKGDDIKILGEPVLKFIGNRSLSEIALSMFLGKPPKSQKTITFFDTCLRLLVDHGPDVSGVVNTMITARAGKDLTASLASGILTIGPRFGGAINQAARSWFLAVNQNQSADDFVEYNARQKIYLAGIGHKKYSLDNPDPRVQMLLQSFDIDGPYINFAKQVAVVTTRKKNQLILNVDGTIAALLLDLLKLEEKYNQAEISELLRTDFCNAIFVLARTVGFIAHHLEQQRLDEGLFRLPSDLLDSIDSF